MDRPGKSYRYSRGMAYRSDDDDFGLMNERHEHVSIPKLASSEISADWERQLPVCSNGLTYCPPLLTLSSSSCLRSRRKWSKFGL